MSESRVETPPCEIDSLTTCPDCHETFLSWQNYYHLTKCPKEATKVNCDTCNAKTTTKGELVMETYACDRLKDTCLNCCGCDDHAGEPWFTALTIHRHYSFRRHHNDDLEIYLTLHDLPEDTPEEETRLKAWEVVRSEVVRGGGWYLADVETQVCA